MQSMINSSRQRGAVKLTALAVTAIMATWVSAVSAQNKTLTATDYAQAERFLSYTASPLVDHDLQKVRWLDDGHFWYRDHDSRGDHFMRMAAATIETRPITS